MKKCNSVWMVLVLLAMACTAQAQVTIGSDVVPDASAMLDVVSTNKGFLPPRMTTAQRDAIVSPAVGLVIYNTSTNCLNFYNGTGWYSSCGSPAFPLVSALDCSGATHNGTLKQGIAASGVSSAIAYTGGNGFTYALQTVTSTGVTGLTATLSAGTLASGAGTLTYTISGTPASAGTASFALNVGGQNCSFTRTVVPPFTIPASITLNQNQRYFVASAYDVDYLPYTTPTVAASTATLAAGGGNEAVTVNVQGSITTTGVTISIPVTATGSATLPAYSLTVTVPAALTEDGISRDLTLSWASQPYTSSTKTITATIQAVGGTLNAKKLDINAGLGNDYLGVLLGTFTYPYNNAGATTTYQVRNIPGMPDKLFGQADNSGSTISHNMLYSLVQGEDGKTWLNNNLGADYANLNKASFNITKQATAYNDYKAYGSLLQWGRKADGHELITWTGSLSANGAPVNTPTNGTNNNAPTHAQFITEPSSPYDWRVSQDDALWATEASANNPCPSGFRVPTNDELTNLFSAAGITNYTTAASSKLKLSVPGGRGYDGALHNAGDSGGYWSSSVSGTDARYRFFSSGTYTSTYGRAVGFAVRCVKD